MPGVPVWNGSELNYRILHQLLSFLLQIIVCRAFPNTNPQSFLFLGSNCVYLKHNNNDEHCRHLPSIDSIISLCSILKRWYRSWRKDIRRRDEQRVLDEARARREAQGNDLPESLMCVVCCGLRDVLLVPCRHVCVCSECALKLNPRVCPVCRTEIERIQPVFYS